MKVDARKLARWTMCLVVFLNVASGSLLAQSSVTVAWNAVSDPLVTGYNLHYGTASQDYTNLVSSGMAASVVVPNLIRGTTYYFAVGAYGTLGIEGPYSAEISYTVPTSLPPPVITMTSPPNGAGYAAPATITVAATVIANGHTITKVQFLNNGALVGENTAAPYNFTLANLAAGAYFLTARAVYDSGSLVSTTSAISVGTALDPIVSIAADSGTISLPFVTLNGTILQNILTTLLGGGRAVYNFTVPKTGDYMLSAQVSAPNSSANSFYLNIDAEPTDPMSLWNLPVTVGFTNQPVTWQGVSDTVPKVFSLTAGTHQLIVRGHEPNAQLGTISVWPAPFKARVNAAKQVTLSGVGQPGHSYDIEATQNLKTWTKIGSVTIATDGSYQFTDPTLATYSSRSYRLVIH